MPEKQNIAKRLERDHPVLSEDSPLNKHLLRATGLPDMKSLLMALAHPMTEDDVRKLGQKAGNHQAHHNRIKHLREHAIKKHGVVGESPPEDDETSSRYPRRTKTGAFRDPYVNHEDAGLTEFDYLHKSFTVLPFVPLQKAVIQEQTSKEGGPGVRFAPEAPKTQPATAPSPTSETPPTLRGSPERGMPGSVAPSRHTISYDPQAGRTRLAHHHLNGAGYLESGPGPAPFRANYNFDQADPHEAAVHQALTKLGHQNPGSIANTVLYQDFLPDPHDPTKGQGDTAAPGSERSQMAANIARVHGGITKEQAHSVLDRVHAEAHAQFNTHPMHSMDDITKPNTANGERSAEFEVPRNKQTGEKIYNAGNKPIELKHVARQIRQWNSIPVDQRNATRKWYNTEAHEYIKDLASAFNVPYLKAAGTLALYNNGMGWETGAAGAAQSLAGGDSLGVKYVGGKSHDEPTGEEDEEGNPIMKKVGHEPGDPMTILKQTYPSVQAKINDIVNSSDNPDEIMGKIRQHLKTNKLGNFFMDMIGAAPYHTNTNDRHELAIAGHTHKPGTVRGDKDLSGKYQETASDAEHRYFWRAKNAVAHQLDVDPREVQAANWVNWRREKAAGTDKGENFPGWRVVREHVDNMLRDRASGDPAELRRVEKRIQDRKDREIELEHIMPTTPVVQPGMSRKLATDVRKERSRLAAEQTTKKRAGEAALTAQQERWAATDEDYGTRRSAALERAETKRRERREENARRKRAGQEPLPETTEEEEAKSLAQDGVDYYNYKLRKSYEQLRWQPPLTFILIKH